MSSLDDYVAAQREAMIHDLQELIGIESVKGPAEAGAPFGRGIRAALERILTMGERLGLAAKNVDGYAGHLEFGAGEELVGVLVHVDVVPAGDGWSHPPYAGVIDGGRLYGRGAVDDKGPAVACLHALAALKASGFKAERRVRLIIGCDEESGWACVDRYFAREERPRCGFSPDANFPLIVAEKGLLGLELFRDWRGETGEYKILSLEGGARANIVPEKCTARLAVPAAKRAQVRRLLEKSGVPLSIAATGDGFLLAAEGTAAHASTPGKGLNAIGRMCAGLAALAAGLPGEQAGVIGFLGRDIGLAYDGSGLNITARDDVSGSLTSNVGTIAWDENGVKVAIDIRYPVSVDKEWVLRGASAAARSAGLETRVGNALDPLYVPQDTPLVQKLLAVFKEKTGSDARPYAIGGRTYACAIGNGVAFGPIFPGGNDLAHQRDECISLDALDLCARIYASAIAALLRD